MVCCEIRANCRQSDSPDTCWISSSSGCSNSCPFAAVHWLCMTHTVHLRLTSQGNGSTSRRQNICARWWNEMLLGLICLDVPVSGTEKAISMFRNFLVTCWHDVKCQNGMQEEQQPLLWTQAACHQLKSTTFQTISQSQAQILNCCGHVLSLRDASTLWLEPHKGKFLLSSVGGEKKFVFVEYKKGELSS